MVFFLLWVLVRFVVVVLYLFPANGMRRERESRREKRSILFPITSGCVSENSTAREHGIIRVADDVLEVDDERRRRRWLSTAFPSRL